MRVGLLSDIHGNKIALEAVLADMPDVDQLVCAGDVVGYNPWPADCVEALRERDVPTVMGNHDRRVVENRNFRGHRMAQAGFERARTQLSEAQRDWLAGLPDEGRCFDGELRVVHGHPDDPNRYTRKHDFHPRLLGEESVLVLGHTHVQHVETFESGIVCNPGSVGQPRDRDPRAAYAVLDLEPLEISEHRVEYDIEAVAEAIDAAEMPDRTAKRLFDGR